MAIKILVNQIGQHVVADIRQVENNETGEVLAYLLKEPRLISYQTGENGALTLRMAPFCPASDENEFPYRTDHVAAILEPRADVAEQYVKVAYPTVDYAAAAELKTGEGTLEEILEDDIKYKIEKFIDLNLNEVSIEKIKNEFKLSNYTLYNIMDRKNPGEIIRRKRLFLVKNLRKQGVPEKEISKKTGFSLNYLRNI